MTLKREVGGVCFSTQQYSSHYSSLMLLNISIAINFRNCSFGYINIHLLHFLMSSLVKVFIILSIFIVILKILIKIVLRFVSGNVKILITSGFLYCLFFSPVVLDNLFLSFVMPQCQSLSVYFQKLSIFSRLLNLMLYDSLQQSHEILYFFGIGCNFSFIFYFTYLCLSLFFPLLV